MIMKFNIMRLIDILNVLDKFTNADKELAYAISKTKLNIINEISEYYEHINDLAKTYGEKSENGNYIVSKESDQFNEYITKVSEILSTDVEIDVYQIPRDVFVNSNYFNPDCLEAEYDILFMLFSEKPNTSEKDIEKNTNIENLISEESIAE